MNETLSAEGIWSIIDYVMIPWGNAYYSTSMCGGGQEYSKDTMYCWTEACGSVQHYSANPDCFGGSVMCQHGESECYDNLLEGCAVFHYSPYQYAPFVYCLEAGGTGQACADSAGMDWNLLSDCVSGSDGNKVSALNAWWTASYGPTRQGTPWVLVNGQVVEDVDNLLMIVCGSYKGTKPEGCADLIPHNRTTPLTISA